MLLAAGYFISNYKETSIPHQCSVRSGACYFCPEPGPKQREINGARTLCSLLSPGLQWRAGRPLFLYRTWENDLRLQQGRCEEHLFSKMVTQGNGLAAGAVEGLRPEALRKRAAGHWWIRVSARGWGWADASAAALRPASKTRSRPAHSARHREHATSTTAEARSSSAGTALPRGRNRTAQPRALFRRAATRRSRDVIGGGPRRRTWALTSRCGWRAGRQQVRVRGAAGPGMSGAAGGRRGLGGPEHGAAPLIALAGPRLSAAACGGMARVPHLCLEPACAPGADWCVVYRSRTTACCSSALAFPSVKRGAVSQSGCRNKPV